MNHEAGGRTLPNWRDLVTLPEEELGRYDISAVNLACAAGLPSSETIDFAECLSKLDVWATCVQLHTARLMPQFHRKPHEYENSEAYFLALAMITVLQRDLGVRYNPAKIPADAKFDTADTFIHGITHGDGGTCATLPVVYAAVGRRLGYPIRLVSTRGRSSGHLFARWDDPARGDRFNIEATNIGLTTPTDEEMRTGRYQLTDSELREGCYLQSMTPRMELSVFLGERGWCFEDAGDWRNCVEAWAAATNLVPENVCTRNSLRRCMIS